MANLEERWTFLLSLRILLRKMRSLKQSLGDEIHFIGEEKDDASKSLIASSEAHANADGDLAVWTKTNMCCQPLTAAASQEWRTSKLKSKSPEELEAIAAKAVLKENTDVTL